MRLDYRMQLMRNNKMLVIAPAAFLSSFGIGTINLGMLFIIKDLYHATPSQVGAFGALWSVAYFFGCIILKRFTARMVPRASMITMQAGSALLLTLFMLKPGLWQAFVMFAFYGFITAFFWPPVMGWLSRGVEGKDLSRATSAFNFSWSVAGVISPFTAGLMSQYDKFLPVYAGIAIFGTNAAFIMVSRFIIKDSHENEGRSGESQKHKVDKSTPLRYPAWIGVALSYMVMGVVFNVFPVYARDVLATSESSVGLILAIRALTTMTGFLLLGRFSVWQFKRSLVPAVTLLQAAVLVATIFQTTPLGFMVCFGILGALLSVTYNNSLFYSTSGALDRDKRVNTHEALLTGGQVIGSISGGMLYQAFSLPHVFAIMCGALALGSVFQIVLVKGIKRNS